MTASSIAQSSIGRLTLVDVLRARASADADRRAFLMLDAESEAGALTYGELDRDARAIAANLADNGGAGARVLLLYPPGLDFVRAFFGCLYAGAIAVPCLPPGSTRQVERLTAVIRDAGAAFWLADSGTAKIAAGSNLESLKGMKRLSPPMDSAAAECWRDPGMDAADVALLQYTSGSTRDPRGVVLSHANLIANSSAIRQTFRIHAESVIVSWLPPYHDMGLIGGMIQPVFAGVPCVLLPPAAFLQRPFRWLKAISDYRADISGGPNFAYDVCADRITEAEKATLDLNCWRAAFTGSEPVLASTLERFAAAFSPCGFERAAFFPCYGLAESTLMVTGAVVGYGPKEMTVDAEALENGRVAPAESDSGRTRRLVSCGRPVQDQAVAVVALSGPKLLEEARIGEVWVAGPSVAAGYWSRPEESAARFAARLPGEAGGPYLRTGDLGCLIDGELYITGRAQDLIILRGRNHYAEDIEETVRTSHPLLHSGRGTAFQLRKADRDHLAVVHETATSSHGYDEIVSAVAAAVAARHAVMPSLIQLVRRGSVPRTTSGKVRRGACKEAALEGRLPVLALLDRTEGGAEDIEEPVSPAEAAKPPLEYIRTLAARSLGISAEAVDIDSPLVGLGIDSLAAAGIASGVANAFGVEASAASILNGWTVAEIAHWVEQNASPRAQDRQSAARAPLPPLMPATIDQQRLWMQHRISSDASALNLQTVYLADGRLDAALLARAFDAVVERHAALRTGFESQGRLMQRVTAAQPGISIADCTEIRDSSEEDRIAYLAALERGRHFDLAKPPLIRLTLLRLRGGVDALVLTVHHIAADAASLNVLAKDLESAYNSGPESAGMARAPQYLDYAEREAERMNQVTRPAELGSWADLMRGVQQLFEANARAERESHQAFTLGRPAHDRLKEFARRYNATPFTAALAALQLTLHAVTGRTRFAVAVPFHNHTSTEFLEAVGPFAQPRFVVAGIKPEATLEEFLAQTKAGVLHAHEHGELSVAEVAAGARTTSDGPVRIEALFTMLPPMMETLEFREIGLSGVEILPSAQDCDLFVAARATSAGLRVAVSSKLTAGRTEEISRVLRWLIERVPEAAAARVKDLTKEVTGAERGGAVPVVVAATFATEPLRPVFEFWDRLLNMQAAFDFAAFAQLGQQLLNPEGSLRRNRSGFNVMLLRAADLTAGANGSMALSIAEFASAVAGLAEGSQSHQIVCLCPAEEDASSGSVSHSLEEAWRGVLNISLLNPADILRLYPVARVYDKYGEDAAGVPYTEDYFAALGTTVVRRMCALQRRFLRKAIVVDCDNTLWEGVVAEDTPGGVSVSERCCKLQRWLSERKAEGFLLCLCSKNNEADIREAFQCAAGNVLSWEDFAASRINWNDKSSNLRELAAELSLSLDSFVLLDDNPIECAEVEANCPGALCIHLPADTADPEAVLRQIWAFDSIPASAEAARRTELYREQTERARALEEAPSLAEFLERLETRIDVFEPSRADVRRLAELTARTTQFNALPGARSESEIASWLEDARYVVRAIRVEDRFGQLGVVGCAAFRREGSALQAELFLLSCRALGRGVEHSMLMEMGRTAETLGCSHIVIPYRSTQRNEPVRRFLETIAGDREAWARDEARLSAAAASEVEYVPPRSKGASDSQPVVEFVEPAAPLAREVLRQIASTYASAGAIVAALRTGSRVEATARTIVPPRTPTEARIAQMMADLLGIERVGRDEDFFALGGHSLMGTRLLSRVAAEFQVSIPIETLFTTKPTVAALADLVDAGVIMSYDASAIESAMDPIADLSDAEIERLLAEDFAQG